MANLGWADMDCAEEGKYFLSQTIMKDTKRILWSQREQFCTNPAFYEFADVVARLAQSAEHQTLNLGVASSSLALGE